MKKHRVILSLLTFVLVAALLLTCGGCGSGDNTTATTTSQTTSTTQTSTTSTTSTTTQTSTTQTTTEPSFSITDLLTTAMNMPSVYFETVTANPTVGAITAKWWVKGTKAYIEVPATMIKVYLYAETQEMYVFVALTNTIYKMEYDPDKAPVTPAQLLSQPITVIGEEDVNGQTCVVVEYTYEDTVTKVWINKATGFPVKMDNNVQGMSATTTWQNFSFEEIDDSMFDLPTGYPIITVDPSSLPIQLPF